MAQAPMLWNFFSYSIQLSMKFVLLINFKLLTLQILSCKTWLSMYISLLINMKMPFSFSYLLAEKISCSAEHEKSSITSRPGHWQNSQKPNFWNRLRKRLSFIIVQPASVAQSNVRPTGDQEVLGSIPAGSVSCLLCWGLMTHQPLWFILCHLQEKGRKETRGDEREGQGRKRNKNESEETEELETFPL